MFMATFMFFSVLGQAVSVFRKALATTGSNWVPMHRLISSRAAAIDIAGR